MAVSFSTLWKNHPYPAAPCVFTNQCAIRMGIAFQQSGIDTSTFRGVRCWHGHSPAHILRAEQLANWMRTRVATFGTAEIHRRTSSTTFNGRTGIVFIKDGWGSGDHIDLWNGSTMKGGDPSWFARGQQVWFWPL